MTIASAASYSRAHGGRAFVARQDGVQLLAEGQNGFPLDGVWDIQSGSKTFWGPVIAELIREGRIGGYDSLVSDVITEWQSPPLLQQAKKTTTWRAEMSLTSGHDPGTPGNPVSYERAISSEFNMPAGRVGDFRYGPGPWSVLGMAINRLVLALGYASPTDYLNKRILSKIGVTVKSWDLINGNPLQPHLAGGAHIAAKQWALFGEYLVNGVVSDLLLAELVKPVNPLYGITVWLCLDNDPNKPLPYDGFAAAGDGNNRLYMFPKLPNNRRLVIARFGVDDPTWSDSEFVKRAAG